MTVESSNDNTDYRSGDFPYVEVPDCPFCGQSPDSTDYDFCYPINATREGQPRIYRAGCIESHGGCGAEVLGDSVNDAIKKWCTRVPNANIDQCPFCGQTLDVTDSNVCYAINFSHGLYEIYTAECAKSKGGCGANVLGDSKEEVINILHTRVTI